jgi:hypothetical protein
MVAGSSCCCKTPAHVSFHSAPARSGPWGPIALRSLTANPSGFVFHALTILNVRSNRVWRNTIALAFDFSVCHSLHDVISVSMHVCVSIRTHITRPQLIALLSSEFCTQRSREASHVSGFSPTHPEKGPMHPQESAPA